MTIEVAFIGIDGSGKSSNISQSARYLGDDYSVVVLGWKSITYIEGGKVCYLSSQKTGKCPGYLKRLSFLSTRIRTTWYRLRKASLIKGLDVDFCIEDRDLVLDPSILVISYLAMIRKTTLSSRVSFLRRVTGGRLSDVYVYLDISPQAGYERVCLRHREEGKKLSAHENLQHLSQLRSEYEAALAFLEKSDIPVFRVNTEDRAVEDCSREIVEFLRQVSAERELGKNST